jgi:hypothetical protein
VKLKSGLRPLRWTNEEVSPAAPFKYDISNQPHGNGVDSHGAVLRASAVVLKRLVYCQFSVPGDSQHSNSLDN